MKIWLRFSTFSFFTALICEGTNYAEADGANTTYKKRIQNISEEKRENTRKRDLTCLSVVVTGLALFLGFKCLFATWKTFFCFFPFCLFFAMIPGDRKTKEWGDVISIPEPVQLLCLAALCVVVVSALITPAHCSLKKTDVEICSRFPVCLLQSAAIWFAMHSLTHKVHSLRQSQRNLTGNKRFRWLA